MGQDDGKNEDHRMSPNDIAHITDAQTDIRLQQFLTYRLSRVQAKLNTQASRLLRDHAGITLTQWRILALIGVEGLRRSSDLSRHAALDKGMISRNVKSLLADGLILSEGDDSDQRAQMLCLTEKGRQLVDRTLPIMRKRQALLRGALEAGELATLYRALDKLELAAEAQDFD
ncbi:MAG: MarR family winged helix-turn-helix transcriptional regulator [Rhodobacterales bacterium]|nr:MarR family winged helix-turn-helix transcriptional regulator [Rhodobacterales bacterium]MDX5391929.1 MarR family winged helix-turn-helix transcriptional regulator [Rhodobacterales bacterium]MDX5491628.1 MarR family winged helix-turn-helix transcriptional regulator [Rhodobacterales bacterium]